MMKKYEQVMKRVNKLIDIIKVSDLTENERVERELALVGSVTAEQGITRAEDYADCLYLPGADSRCWFTNS